MIHFTRDNYDRETVRRRIVQAARVDGGESVEHVIRQHVVFVFNDDFDDPPFDRDEAGLIESIIAAGRDGRDLDLKTYVDRLMHPKWTSLDDCRDAYLKHMEQQAMGEQA